MQRRGVLERRREVAAGVMTIVLAIAIGAMSASLRNSKSVPKTMAKYLDLIIGRTRAANNELRSVGIFAAVGNPPQTSRHNGAMQTLMGLNNRGRRRGTSREI
jgi:hypothetical protein